MPGSFLDTTVVVHVSDPKSSEKNASVQCINNNQPSSAPYYALKELLNGPIRNLCNAHNILLAADDPGMAMASIARMYYRAPRKKDSSIQAIILALQDIWQNNPNLPAGQMKEECLGDLLLRITRTWRNAQRISNVNLVDSLACFNHGDITLGPSNEVQGPNGHHNCLKNKQCSAAHYLYDKKLELGKLIDSLHPSKIDKSIANKQETISRRNALKELKNKGPKDFNKAKCPALGDAYFALMCPPGNAVLTTNVVDHKPLCDVLGVAVIKP